MDSWEELGKALEQSERNLSKYTFIKDRNFINFPQKALALQTRDFMDKNPAGVQEIEGGYALPLRKSEVKTSSGTFLGGGDGWKREFCRGTGTETGA